METDLHKEKEELLGNIIKFLVDSPDSVVIDITNTEHSTVFDIEVAAEDVGKVLGRKGQYADSIRVLFSAIYGKIGKKVHLHIIDPRQNGREKKKGRRNRRG